MKRLIVTGLLTLSLLSVASAQLDPIRFGYVLWDSEIASTHVLAAVIEDELGYETDLIAVDAGPMYIGLAQGDLDLSVSVALPVTHANYWEQYGDRLIDLGRNLDGAFVGLVVPEYVTVDSLADLNEYADRFDGQIIGIDPGAGIMDLTEQALEVYGLTDFELVDGSDPAMIAALDRAVERGDWIVITGWDPHWKWVVYDLKYLEDPEGLYGEIQGSNTVITPGFAEKAPEDLLNLLDNFYWSPDDMGVVMLDINQHDVDPWDAARDWIANNREIVESWLE